jgi:hypothetical protein
VPADGAADAKPQAAVVAAPAKPPERPARFTTIEEEEARRAAQHRRSWLVLAGQLAVLAAVLAGMGGVAYYLSRPRSADELYQKITSRPNIDNPDSLTSVSNEIDEFVKRYPNDPRASEMRGYQGQVALLRLERRLQHSPSDIADPSLLPIEQMYLRAMSRAKESPEEAATKLQALIDLHPPGARLDAGHGADERSAAVVQRAQRRLDVIRAEIAEQTERERVALVERMAAAGRLADAKPQAAAAMYRAIVELYGESAWAKEIVAEAQRRLGELEKKE